jgi:2-dehydropantoate 2-reductase
LSVPLNAAAEVSNGVSIVSPKDVRVADGILFATKGHHLPEAARSLAHVRTNWVAGFQNGVVKDDVLAGTFERKRVLGAATTLGGERHADGSVLLSTLGMTYLGELDGVASDRVEKLAATFVQAGIPTQVAIDIQAVEWSKLVNAAASFGVSILARASSGEALENPHLTRAFLVLAREVGNVAAAEGVRLGDYVGISALTYVSHSQKVSASLRKDRFRRMQAEEPENLSRRTSMLQDLLLGKAIEAEPIFGDLVERAYRHGIDVPRLELVRDLARGLDPGRKNQSSRHIRTHSTRAWTAPS